MKSILDFSALWFLSRKRHYLAFPEVKLAEFEAKLSEVPPALSIFPKTYARLRSEPFFFPQVLKSTGAYAPVSSFPQNNIPFLAYGTLFVCNVSLNLTKSNQGYLTER